MPSWSFPTREMSETSLPSDRAWCAKLAGAPPGFAPEGRRSQRTSPKATMWGTMGCGDASPSFRDGSRGWGDCFLGWW